MVRHFHVLLQVKPVGGIKPPKLKVEDEDRTFVQRSAVEQFRPAGKFTAPKCAFSFCGCV